MLLLFDLQNALENEKAGVLSNTLFLPFGEETKLSVTEIEDEKSVFVSNRKSNSGGLEIFINKAAKYVSGDRITITGRADDCSVEMHLCDENDNKLVQISYPNRDNFFVISYILDVKDVRKYIRLVSRPRARVGAPADFHVDRILIARASENVPADSRSVVYIMDNDRHLKALSGGGYTEFLFASGDPLYTVFGGIKRSIINVSRRENDWDGIDIRTSLMNLVRGNEYHIRVTGRVDGDAPLGAEITLQLLPMYSWRGTQAVRSNQDFNLTHTFSREELETLDRVRITTNSAGAKMSFFVYGIEIIRTTESLQI
jgi:hypothetical protein